MHSTGTALPAHEQHEQQQARVQEQQQGQGQVLAANRSTVSCCCPLIYMPCLRCRAPHDSPGSWSLSGGVECVVWWLSGAGWVSMWVPWKPQQQTPRSLSCDGPWGRCRSNGDLVIPEEELSVRFDQVVRNNALVPLQLQVGVLLETELNASGTISAPAVQDQHTHRITQEVGSAGGDQVHFIKRGVCSVRIGCPSCGSIPLRDISLLFTYLRPSRRSASKPRSGVWKLKVQGKQHDPASRARYRYYHSAFQATSLLAKAYPGGLKFFLQHTTQRTALVTALLVLRAR